ncbi:MAG: polysaccharide deacetylase family protein [Oscillospiraceae bacterium]|nr:polysaccharide deacetylase family protein [Oscillospiraceae bacterium]
MKKILLYILCLSLVFTAFSACKRVVSPPPPAPKQPVDEEDFIPKEEPVPVLPAPKPPEPPAPLDDPGPEPQIQEDEPVTQWDDLPLQLNAAGTVVPGMPMVAITFDDGPGKFTGRILDILERHGARATFCVVGTLLEQDGGMETAARTVAVGSEVIGHSWSHEYFTQISEDEVRTQILDTARAIENATGISTNLYRPPYGRVDERVERISRELGFALVKWSVDPRDWETKDADLIYDEIMRGVHDGAIIIAHDSYSTTADAMERVVPALIERGYQLVTVSELLMHTYGTVEAGKVYNK